MLGIYGGTFNPVHNGHLMLAETIRDEFALSGILFVPAHIPPHKADEHILAANHRLQMLQLAISGNEYFHLDEVELARIGYSYTVDTLQYLQETRQESLAMIIGADSLVHLHTWRQPEQLLKMADLIVARRPEITEGQLQEACLQLKNQYQARIHLSEAIAMPISSSYIRKRAAQGRSFRYHIPEPVFRYMQENTLYETIQEEST